MRFGLTGCLCAGLLVLATLPARANDAAVYQCGDGFTLDATDEGLQLTGVIDTPTPGFRALYMPDRKSIHLLSPEGMVVKMLSTADIDIVLPYDVINREGKIAIALEKPYDWGISAITCTRADSAPSLDKDTP